MIKSETPVFFIDREEGKWSVADALRQAGVRVEIHDDRLLLILFL
ncbi:hypothetical protein PN499_18480 [Kamptonema animale CS-326]|nr:hypothetical protein [Kamptonema animale]MDB9513184.1 hypothetical protein [Kamptonema animale CS-326]